MNDILTSPFGAPPSSPAHPSPSDHSPLDRSPSDRSSLDHLSLLAVRGADARTFLDSQLTRNVPSASAPATFAGYCSPKGRLLATFVVWADDEAIWLLVSRDIAPAIAKRLRLYVLRAKVTIDDVGATYRLDGFVGERSQRALAAAAPWYATRSDDCTWLRFPDAGPQPRYLRIASHDAFEQEREWAVDGQRWRWLDIRAALPWVTAATQDRFVPQMLNLEALGAVDFKKGCFPGQEIVARSQYLGKLKRRMALATCDAPTPAAGIDVWNVGDREPCGVVVDAQAEPDGPVSLLVELPLAAFASSTLRIGSQEGPPLTIEPLPYELPDNEVFVRPKL